jgi:HPP family
MNSTPVVDRFIEGIGLRICFFEATDEPSLLYRCSVLGDEATLRLSGYLWVAAMFGVLATLEANRIGVFLVPPFAATLTILMLLSEAPVAQPYALIVGSVCGAAVGTGASFFGSGLGVAVLAMIAAFVLISLIHAYHRSRPGIHSRPAPPGSLVSSACRASFHRRSGRICGGNE